MKKKSKYSPIPVIHKEYLPLFTEAELKRLEEIRKKFVSSNKQGE